MKRSAMMYKCHRFPPEIIQDVVWLYHRFNLSSRDIEDLMAERGIAVSYELIRQRNEKSVGKVSEMKKGLTKNIC